MSVKIEILDYKYLQSNVVNWSNNQLLSGWTAGTGISASITPSPTGVLIEAGATALQYSGYYSPNVTLINNHSYTLSYTCVSLDNGSQTDSNFFIRGSGSGVGTYRPFSSPIITTGYHSYTFTMDTSQNNSVGTMDLYFQLTNGHLGNKNIKIRNVKLVDNTSFDVIDWDNSFVGELDVTEHSDFPLALTFQISDLKDITSTSGDYSKTFKIPASKNNNKVLKHLFSPQSITTHKASNPKPCRIMVDGTQCLVGDIQITSIGGYDEQANYYDCVFFGNNTGWALKLEDKYMSDLSWGSNGEGLIYNKSSIINTWSDLDCNSSTSYIVYPIASYGDYNPDGTAGAIQLLDTASNTTIPNGSTGYYGFDDSGNSYGTPPPTSDWRPAVFVKNTIDRIFNSVGYNVVSNFMDTDMFKKLVWLLPSFQYNDIDKIMNLLSVQSTWINHAGELVIASTAPPSVQTPAGALSLPGVYTWSQSGMYKDQDDYYYTEAGRKSLDITSDILNVTLDNSSAVDFTGHYIEIQEYGYYNVSLNGIESRLARGWWEGGGGASTIENKVGKVYTKFNIEVKTVGQTSWNIINTGGSTNEIDVNVYTDVEKAAETTSYTPLESYLASHYFNKGDKIRITSGVKFTNTGGSSSSVTFEMNVFFKGQTNSNFNVVLQSEDVTYGQTYNLQDVMSTSQSQIEFIKGVSHAFNLSLTTNQISKEITIEPFSTFYKPYKDGLDWTYKLDLSKEIQDKWIESDLKRRLIFKYKTDPNDPKVKERGLEYFDGVEDEYPYHEELSKDFKKGESVYENDFFAGTYMTKDIDTTDNSVVDTAYSARIWNELGSTPPEKSHDFLPRLMYWHKYSPDYPAAAFVASGTVKIAYIQLWTYSNRWVKADAALSVYPSVVGGGIYPQATFYDRNNASSPVLSYGNVWISDYNNETGVYGDTFSGKGLYETYYRVMVDMLKTNPRKRIVYIDLKINDIINLDLRKLVYINGVYWRINRVIDYQPNKNQSTKVELLEWIETGAFSASHPVSGNTGGSPASWGTGMVDPAPDSGDDFISGVLVNNSDINLKHNIINIGNSPSGIPIYEFSYIGESDRYIGAMAQDLINLGRNDAVTKMDNGYYGVYYDKIDIDFIKK